MPELPEVETVRRSLERRLPGRIVRRVEVRFPTLREPLDARALKHHVEGFPVVRLRRRAKYLLIDLESSEPGGSTLVIHLGMSGRLTLVPGDEEVEKHEHLAFHLDDGHRLRLVDPRRFGVAFAIPSVGLEEDRHFAHLGVEPMVDLTPQLLMRRATGRRGPVKNFLMDARVVVGVGNIYACESLWQARVHPQRSLARISGATWERLTDHVQKVLGRAIEEGGTTLNDFQDGEGNAGYFQVSLAVYGRDGEPCLRCGRTIRRIVLGGRGTFYCPGCQR